MPKLVVMGATLKCNKGSKPCSLTPCTVNSIVTGSGLVASMFDHQVGENILNFGKCDVAPKKCNPVTPLPWEIVWTNALVGSAPPVTMQSKLRCFKTGGAEITITYSGQETIELSDGTASKKDHNFLDTIGNSIGSVASDVWDSRHELLAAGSVVPDPEVGAVFGIGDQALYYGEAVVAKFADGDQPKADQLTCQGHYAGAAAISSEVGGRLLKKAGVPEVEQATVNALQGILGTHFGEEGCE